MPKSNVRKQADYTPPPPKRVRREPRVQSWVGPIMVTLFLVGLAWIVVYYVSQSNYPIGSFGDWNLAIGLALIAGGFIAATKWK